MIDYIKYRTKNNTIISTWADIFNKFISTSPLIVSSTTSGSIQGTSNGGNPKSNQSTLIVNYPKKGDIIICDHSFTNNNLSLPLSNDEKTYVSYDNESEVQVANGSTSTIYTVTKNATKLTIRVYTRLSCWTNNITCSGTAKVTATYNGSFENFLSNY